MPDIEMRECPVHGVTEFERYTKGHAYDPYYQGWRCREHNRERVRRYRDRKAARTKESAA